MPVSQLEANRDLDNDYGANVATTIASGSNSVNTSTFAGAGVLNVVTTATFHATGTVTVVTAGTPALITYTGISGTTFTGCTTIAGGGVMSTGGAVTETIFLALATALPSPSGGGGAGTFVEPNTTTQWVNYVRIAVFNTVANWSAASAGSKANAVAQTFATSGGGASSPVTLSYLVTCDYPTGGTGRIIDYLALPGSTIVGSGQSLTFPIGSITITEA